MMKKRIFIAMVALSALGQGVWAQTSIPGLTYNYNSEGYYEISSPAALNALATYVNAGNNCRDLTFKVTADITFTASDTFTPIGYGEEDDGAPFSGTFDGQNNTISGIAYEDTEGAGIGLFGYVHNPAKIQNVKLDGCSFTGNFHVGAIAGNSSGATDDNTWGVYNCTVGSNVTVTAATATIEGEELPGTFAGGIIGDCVNMTVSNCFSAATVNGDQYVGGIAGRLLSSRNENAKERCVIDNCYFTGTAAVAGEASSHDAIGARGPIEDFEDTSSGYTNGQILVTLLADDGNEDVKNATRMENYNNQTCDVKISGLTLKKDDKWHAICLPFGLDATTGTPLEGATLMAMDFAATNFADGTLTLNFSEATGNISGNTPYLVKWSSGSNTDSPEFKNVNVAYSGSPTTQEHPAAVADFLGITAPNAFEAGDRTVLLVDDGDKLNYPEEAATLGAFSAYFKLKDLEAGTETGVKDYVLKSGETVLISGTFDFDTPTQALTLNDNADNSTAISEANGSVCDVTLEGRTLYKDGSWNTICLPFSLDALTGTPLEGATLMTLSSSSFDNNKLTLNFGNASGIVAGKPYIIKWTKANDYVDDNEHNIYQPTFPGVTIASGTADVTTEAIDFKGNYSPVTFSAGDKTVLYMGSGDKLYYPSTSVNMKAFRGYFKLNDIMAGEIEYSGGVNAIILNFGDDSMGIEETPMLKSQVPSSSLWYTLDGCLINGQPKAKGVYINNGIKIVIK